MQLNNKFRSGDKIVIASHNEGKINEFKILLAAYNLKILTSRDLGILDVKETGKTFKENSLIKAKSVPDNYLTISDDSGLCVNSLGGKPGIFSSRFQKECGGWFEAMERIYSDVKTKKTGDFSAKFICCLSIKFSKNLIYSYLGEIKGKIVWPPKGINGFGYDPFFIPKGHAKTFAEMEHSDKIFIDHRSIALKKLIKLHLNDS
tara:strand:+ start:1040 stop:1651 length:612 start_codon:yes stop_codon:yes gene_type:complete